jgi:hypothetical protein
VSIEFVVLEGEAGQALRRSQAAAMRRVLQWVHDHPAEPPTASGDETQDRHPDPE